MTYQARTTDSEKQAEPIPQGLITCEACQALNQEHLHRCASCDAILPQSLIAPKSTAARETRREALQALRRGHRWMFGVTWTYRLGALAYAIATLMAILSLADSEVPEEAGLLVVGMTTAIAAGLAMGALQLTFQPFVWTIVTATLTTAVAVVHFRGPNPLGFALPASAGLALLLWACLPPTWFARRLIARYQDLYILDHASLVTRHKIMGRSLEERHQRLKDAMRRAQRKAWKFAAAAAFVLTFASALGAHHIVTHVRPVEYDESHLRFEAAWNNADSASVVALQPPGLRETQRTWLDGVAGLHGWADGYPNLEEGIPEELEPGVVRVDYLPGGVELGTTWRRVDRTWVLDELELPSTSLESQTAAFHAAWARSDAAGVAAFVSPETRAALEESIGAFCEHLGWESLPPAVEVDYTLENSGRDALVELDLAEAGLVRTRWYQHGDGRWALVHIKFPKR